MRVNCTCLFLSFENCVFVRHTNTRAVNPPLRKLGYSLSAKAEADDFFFSVRNVFRFVMHVVGIVSCALFDVYLFILYLVNRTTRDHAINAKPTEQQQQRVNS